MRKATVFTIWVLFLTPLFTHLANAAKCKVVNGTAYTIRVAYATWRPAEGKYPAGFRVKGWVPIDIGNHRTFSAQNSLYVRVESDLSTGGQPLQPAKPQNHQQYSFFLHPKQNFTTVESSNGRLIYSTVNRRNLVTMDGFYEFATATGTFHLGPNPDEPHQLKKEQLRRSAQRRHGRFCSTVPLPKTKIRVIDPNAAIARIDALWTPDLTVTPGDTETALILRVQFIGGTHEKRQLVEEVAPTWSRYCPIKFVFDDKPPSDIRISFKYGRQWDEKLGVYQPASDDWSIIGTFAHLKEYEGKPTMNLSFFPREEEANKATILHEFGHALGLAHEHQSPNVKIRWDETVVRAELKKKGWSKTDIETNVLDRLDESRHHATPFDEDSIMLYYFPPRWTKDGKGTKRNNTLSKTDKEFIGKLYRGGIKEKLVHFHYKGTYEFFGEKNRTLKEFLKGVPQGRIISRRVRITKSNRARLENITIVTGKFPIDGKIENGTFFRIDGKIEDGTFFRGELKGYIEVRYVPLR